MSRAVIYVFLVSLTCCLAQEINYLDCTDTGPKDWCKINKITITPCAEAFTNKACNIKRGKSYSIKMDFTALKPIETMKSLPYWAAGATSDLPFLGMKEDACEFTQCPIAENVEQTYDFTLKVPKSLPRGLFDVKWKFWVNGETIQGCCARFYLKLQ